MLWCRHPNDEHCAGCVAVGSMRMVQPLDTPEGESCIIVDHESVGQSQVLTLRASSDRLREDWIASIRTMLWA